MRILFRAGMAGELLPNFLRNAGVRKCGVEAVAQGMKREARQRSPTARCISFPSIPAFCRIALNRPSDRIYRPCLFRSETETSSLCRCRHSSTTLVEAAGAGDRDYLFRLARREPNNLVVPVNGAGRRFAVINNSNRERRRRRPDFIVISCEKWQMHLRGIAPVQFFHLNWV